MSKRAKKSSDAGKEV